MALPLGKSAGDLRLLGRGGLLGLIALAPLTVWWPTLPGWSAVVAATLALWILLLMAAIAAGRSDVPSHRLQIPLAALVAISAVHLLLNSRRFGDDPWWLDGQLEISLTVHAAIMAVLLVVSEELLTGRRRWMRQAAAVGGGSAAVAAVLARLLAGPATGATGMALAGVAGVVLASAVLPRRRRLRQVVLIGGSLCILVLYPASGPPAAAALGAAMLLRLRSWRQGGRMAAGVAALAGGLWLMRDALPPLPAGVDGWLGAGSRAFADVDTGDIGAAWLVGLVGWAGLLWCVGWGAALLATSARSADRRGRSGELGRALVLACSLLAGAVLLGGGLFNPAVNVLFIVAWALLPRAAYRPSRRRSGWWAVAMALVVSAPVGLGQNAGLLIWVARTFGGRDMALHIVAGLIATMMLLWLLGRRWYGAIGAVAASAAVAFGYELAQRLFSSRSAQMDDVVGHLIGLAAAAGLYLLCKGSGWAESPDGRLPSFSGRE